MLSLTPKDQFLGTMIDSTVKTSTPSSILKNKLGATPAVSANPAATAPLAAASPKQAFVSSVASAAPASPISPGPANTQPPSSPITSGPVTTPSGASVDAGTGALLSGPPTNYDQQYKDAFDAYIKSLQPSSEETAAQTYLNGLLDTSRREEAAALERGDTLGFASGEAARVNKNRAFDIQAASDALNAYTGRRSATSEAAKARLEFEKSLRSDEKGFSVSPGEDRYEYDPATRTYKKVASGAAKAPNTAIRSIAGREVLVNEETGQVIKDLGASTSVVNDKPSENEIKRKAQSTLVSKFQQVAGADSYVSPADFKKAKAAWVADGFSGKDFDEIFAIFINPDHSYDYIQQ